MSTDPALVAHLYRRAGFGLTPAEVETYAVSDWSDLVDQLVSGLSSPDPAGDAIPVPKLTPMAEANVPGYTWNAWNEYVELVGWWVQRMVVTDTPLREKLTLLLHCQFPTAWDKVYYASMMYAQNQIFRNLGPGNFEALVQAIAKEPSMLIWLDSDTSNKIAPNQNFPRELMERFTMGAGSYTQKDVIEASRCFTGWELDQQTGQYWFNKYNHDNDGKTVLGVKGNLSGEDVIHVVANTAASSSWVVSRLWSWLAYPVLQTDPVVTDLAPAYAQNLNLTDLMAAIFNHPAFVSPIALQGLVKQPTEWLVGSLRLLGLDATAVSSGTLVWYLGLVGQELFNPPSVGGWGANGYWQTAGGCAGYLQLAYGLSSIADLSTVLGVDQNPTAQVAAVCDLLGLTDLSTQTQDALTTLAEAEPWTGSWPAQQLMTLALLSPEYSLN